MAREEWAMVRLKKATRVKLELVRESLQRALEQGKQVCGIGRDGEITFDTVIDVLINRDTAHKERARKAQKASCEVAADMDRILSDRDD